MAARARNLGLAATRPPPSIAPGIGSSPAPIHGGPPTSSQETDMQEDAQHKVDHQNKLARHEREPLDDQWSQAARATIEKELGELGREGDYRLMNVDCRSSSCLATVEWAGYGVAYVKWSAILAHSLPLPCRTAMYLEEPQDRTKPYQTTVVYECSRAL